MVCVPFHDFSDNLADQLDGFDIVLRLGIIFLKVLEREPDCTDRVNPLQWS